MKKIYLFISLLAVGISSGAQNPQPAPKNLGKQDVPVKKQLFNTNLPSANRHQVSSQGNQTASVLWSDDFSVSTNWVISNQVGNTDNWIIGTTPPQGSFKIDTINSTTQGNGYAMFDSDFLCSGDQIADLTTATPINLINNATVHLTFQQYYRRYNDSTFVFVSNDSVNWSKYVVNPNLEVNEINAFNPSTVILDISSVAGSQDSVWIRFEFYSPDSVNGSPNPNAGCGYSWMIDDVTLYDASPADVSASVKSFPGEYSLIPLSQVQAMTFSGFVTNNSDSAITGVTMTIDVFLNSILVHSDVSAALTIGPYGDSLAATTISYTPPDTGLYIVRYTAQAAGDISPVNDTLFRAFFVSDSSYARDYTQIDNTDLATTLGLGGSTVMFAQKFNVVIQKNITSVAAFVVPYPSAIGHSFTAAVYSDNAGLPGTVQASSLSYTFVAGDSDGVFVNFPMLTTVTVPAASSFHAVTSQNDTSRVNVGLSSNIYTPSTNSFKVGANAWAYLDTLGFPGALIILPHLTDNTVNTTDISGVKHFGVFPNPTNGKVYYNISLEKTDDVKISVVDITGRVVYTETIKAISSYHHSIDLSTFASGAYTLSATTSKGTVNERIVLSSK